MSDIESFGFSVSFRKAYPPDDPDCWEVELPHQCDNWQIAGGEYTMGVRTKREAIRDLARFIKEAKNALDFLVSLPNVEKQREFDWVNGEIEWRDEE